MFQFWERADVRTLFTQASKSSLLLLPLPLLLLLSLLKIAGPLGVYSLLKTAGPSGVYSLLKIGGPLGVCSLLKIGGPLGVYWLLRRAGSMAKLLFSSGDIEEGRKLPKSDTGSTSSKNLGAL